MKKYYLIGLTAIIAAFLSVACRTEIENDFKDLPREGEAEKSFAFSQTIRLVDETNQFYREMVVSSNSKESIQNYIDLKPKIKVYKTYDTNSTGQNLNNETVSSNIPDTATEVFIEFKGGNIPSGNTMEVYFEKPTANNSINARLGESFDTYTFQDELAKGVYTKIVKGTYQITYAYFSRGSAWLSWGWYSRGYITHYGANYNYTFTAVPTYTTTKGVKFSYYTTRSAAQSTAYQYRY